ncbi:MAG: hypothetical protein U0992_06110 [Planctomycetaceae bacterium]
MSSSSRITAVVAREVLDSRGRPTVEAEVHCGDVMERDCSQRASTGRYERLNSATPMTSAGGLGVLEVVTHVRTLLAPAVIGLDSGDQQAIDAAMCEADGTPDKFCCARTQFLPFRYLAHAAAKVAGIPLARHMHAVPVMRCWPEE